MNHEKILEIIEQAEDGDDVARATALAIADLAHGAHRIANSIRSIAGGDRDDDDGPLRDIANALSDIGSSIDNHATPDIERIQIGLESVNGGLSGVASAIESIERTHPCCAVADPCAKHKSKTR